MPELTIDGRSVAAAEGATILEAARNAGIAIPTLCHHEALEPWGGCRLCLVDVTRPEWDGWQKTVVSCLARAEEGLSVDTQSERIVAARRVALDLLLARCPESSTILQLAADHGLEGTSYRRRTEPDDCILCGLCTRVCETFATSAIATWGRGTSRAVGTFGHEPPADCVGCGACAMVCPTAHISDERTTDDYRIWQRHFATAHCTVDPSRCVGCGCCEEACPFSVPRVALRATGVLGAVIPAEHCRGCGACVGACPTGAIEQRVHDFASLAADGADEGATAATGRASETVTVMACGRSSLPAGSWVGEAVDGVRLRVLDVPCSGRATAALLLARIAAGDRGVLVLGRHQSTCRLNGAEDSALDQVGRVKRLLSLAGGDSNRVQFVSPDPGRTGPRQAVVDFASGLAARPGSEVTLGAAAEVASGEGIDGVLASLAVLAVQAGRQANGGWWLGEHGLPAAVDDSAVLYAGSLPYLSVLGPALWRPTDLVAPLRAALQCLAATGGEHVGVVVGPYRSVPSSLGERLGRASRVFVLGEADRALLAAAGVTAVRLDEHLRQHGAALPRPQEPEIVACDAATGSAALLQSLGYGIFDLGSDPLPDRFSLSAADRSAAAQQLRSATEQGASALVVDEPAALARWALLTRVGTWQASRLRIMMVHQLVATKLGLRPPIANGSS